MKPQTLINTLEEIKAQAEMIPEFDRDCHTLSKREWLINNQRHWVIRKLDALIAVVQQEGEVYGQGQS